MKTKNIFKTLAAAMLMPAMLLNTACNKETVTENVIETENTAGKGYTLPVTVSVTRQADDPASKATFNESTKMLEFSEGDKLFVQGSYHEGDYTFAGTLDYVSDGTFSGTITTQTEWTGTIEELLSDDGAYATLLPAGYGEYGYLSITEYDGYDAYLEENFDKAFASSKVTALEQFSCEFVYSYSSGFALKPTNAILNFTITGLAASTEVDVEFSYIQSYDPIVTSGSVTTDASGTATFAIGIKCYTDLNACTLTVGGNAITLVSESKMTASGKIYNINRSAAPAETTVTWNTTNVFNESHPNALSMWFTTPLTYEGITISYSGSDAASLFAPYDYMAEGGALQCFSGDSFTFTAPTGKKFTRIEITSSMVILDDTNWSKYGNKAVWNGTPSNTVTIGSSSSSTQFSPLSSIVFTLIDE